MWTFVGTAPSPHNRHLRKSRVIGKVSNVPYYKKKKKTYPGSFRSELFCLTKIRAGEWGPNITSFNVRHEIILIITGSL